MRIELRGKIQEVKNNKGGGKLIKVYIPFPMAPHPTDFETDEEFSDAEIIHKGKMRAFERLFTDNVMLSQDD